MSFTYIYVKAYYKLYKSTLKIDIKKNVGYHISFWNPFITYLEDIKQGEIQLLITLTCIPNAKYKDRQYGM